MPRVPGRRFYLLAALPPAIGGALAYLLAGGVGEQVASMARIEVPGEAVVELTPGQHILYEEARAGDYRCRLFNPAGEEVVLDDSAAPSTYHTGGRAGVSVKHLYTVWRGGHRLACEGGPATLAVGRGLGSALPLRLIPAAAGLLIGGIVLLVVWSRRRQA